MRIFDHVRLYFLAVLLRRRNWLYDSKKRMSRFHLACIGFLAGKNPKTFMFQKALPCLPVPGLGETCQRYLETIKPIVDSEDFRRTQTVVNEFQRPGGEGEGLQAKLLKRVNTAPNLLEKWWEEFTYFAARGSLIYTNWYMLSHLCHNSSNKIEQASRFITRTLEFKRLLDTETLKPEAMFGTVPLCMHQYARFFSSCRIPGVQKDIRMNFCSEEAKHIIVIRKNQFYWFDVYYEDGSILSATDLKRQLEKIIELSDQSSHFHPPVGVLTTENRTTWAKVRRELIDADASNKDSMGIVERALFIVCLDDRNPKSLDEYAGTALYGDGRNRWFDKPFQIIIQENGHIALNGEHTAIGGLEGANIFEFILANTKTIYESNAPSRCTLSPVNNIRWEITPAIRQAIETAGQHFDQMVATIDLKILLFDHFGKAFIKKFRLSTDGLIQMALQLAYFRMHAGFTLTWESAQTRIFLHGHTGVIRSCSSQSSEFVKTMNQPGCSAELKFEILKKAVNAHARQTREVMNGKGVDHHLLGLQFLASEAGLAPRIFSDKAYEMTWKLSTSQTSTRNGLGTGWATAVNDGYGVSYSVNTDTFYFHISSNKTCSTTDSLRFAEFLEQSLLDIQKICIEQEN